ncbi:MAG: hypothetical protein HYX73_03425, partial [Acidobacteria bacterium]|nr:hypothetical protein [Acidobacteriota bacterium]
MSKEMVVSVSSQDTKIAILEDGQVVEVYFEREQEYSLAGSIYKGRVTRILPGMQSAFVNIGLERDAFLYVSDFLEQVEEYDRVGTTGEERETSRRSPRREETETAALPSPAPPVSAVSEEFPAAAAAPATVPDVTAGPGLARPERSGRRGEPGGQREKPRRFSRRSRRHRGHHRGIPESKYARSGAPPEEGSKPVESVELPTVPILLPGESFAKYRDLGAPLEPAAKEPITEATAKAPINVATATAEKIPEPDVVVGEYVTSGSPAEQNPPAVSREPQIAA